MSKQPGNFCAGGWRSQLQHIQGQRSQHRQSQDRGSKSQAGRHSQPQRQSGQDRAARTSGARTRLTGADKARAQTPWTRRDKPRARPATPQTGAAPAARISAKGCRAGKAGSGDPLRLCIAPLSHRAVCPVARQGGHGHRYPRRRSPPGVTVTALERNGGGHGFKVSWPRPDRCRRDRCRREADARIEIRASFLAWLAAARLPLSASLQLAKRVLRVPISSQSCEGLSLSSVKGPGRAPRQCSTNGTLVTTMPGRYNNATLSRKTAPLCSACCHHDGGTNSGSSTVTIPSCRFAFTRWM